MYEYMEFTGICVLRVLVICVQKEITEQTQNMQLIDLEEELAAELERGDADERQEEAEQMDSGAAPADEAAAAELLAQRQQQQEEVSAAGTSEALTAAPASSGPPGQAAVPMPPPEQYLIIRKDYNPKGTLIEARVISFVCIGHL